MIICGSAEKFEELVSIAKKHGCKFLRSDETIETTLEGLRTGVIKEVEVFLSHKYFDIKNAKLKEWYHDDKIQRGIEDANSILYKLKEE